jgi:hypothetical protein
VWHTQVPDEMYPAVCSSEDIPDIPNPLYILHIPRDVLLDKTEREHSRCETSKCLFHCMTSSLAKLEG